MRSFLLLPFLISPAAAQHTLYTCMAQIQTYWVGAKLPPSGIFRKASTGWSHAGYNHPFIQALDYDGSTLFAAAGNGIIRIDRNGWRILTGNDVTELRDIALDRNQPGTIYFTHTAGVRVSHDSGRTWREISAPLHRKYSEAIRVDRTHARAVVIGNEEGIFRTTDEGRTWTLAGAAGFQVTHIEQSPHDPCLWAAVTQGGGVFFSRDCAATFEGSTAPGSGKNLYDVAFDPTRPGRLAIAGWDVGVATSEDNGKSWRTRNTGLPSTRVWSVIWDPDHSGGLYASVHETALFRSDDSGVTWTKDGLEGSAVFRMKFIPEAAQ